MFRDRDGSHGLGIAFQKAPVQFVPADVDVQGHVVIADILPLIKLLEHQVDAFFHFGMGIALQVDEQAVKIRFVHQMGGDFHSLQRCSKPFSIQLIHMGRAFFSWESKYRLKPIIGYRWMSVSV